jgi:hypothetical protein
MDSQAENDPSNVGGKPGIYEFNPAEEGGCVKVRTPGGWIAVSYTGCECAQPRNKNRLTGLADRE